MQNNMTVAASVIAFLLALGLLYIWPPPPEAIAPVEPEQAPTPVTSQEAPARIISDPISDPNSRVTKKPFGIHVTPSDSPVDPERFTGYHTGVDFEAFPEEVDIDVPVFAICEGELLTKTSASGYGGMLVQACTIQEQAVTVVYGHVRLASVKTAVGDVIKAGEQIAVLGTGFSSETDKERKHLHLGIHKGAAPNTRGYIADAAGLVQWIDVMTLLKEPMGQ